MNWDQFQAILWLRWRLTKNQITRGGQLNAVLSLIVYIMMGAGAVGMTAGGLIGGYFLGGKAPPQVLLVVWDGLMFFFLMFWAAGLMVEIQRAESIDLPRLLHLPITLSQVFVFNYVVSHATPSIVLMVPAMIGLCIGATVGGGIGLAPMLPLALGFVFMITAWTYCLRGWLAALMINKRRRRTVVMGVTLFFILICQLPNLVFNTPYFRNHVAAAAHNSHAAAHGANANDFIPEGAVRWHAYIPPGWPGLGALDLKHGELGFPAAVTFATWTIGVLGVWRAYRLTLRFYQGAGGGETARTAQPAKTGRPRRMLVERTVPGLPEDTAALALATFRSMLRAPEFKMALVAPAAISIVGISAVMNHAKIGLGPILAPLAATGVVMVSIFSMAPLMSNAFGLDRSAFRGLMLLPTARDRILLAKNIACLPFNLGIAVVMLLGARFVIHMPWLIFLAGLVQELAAFFLFALAGNVSSILAPFRVNPGTLQAKKPKVTIILASLGAMLATPIILLPIVIPAGLQMLCIHMDWVPWLPVDLILALAVLAGAAALYRALLPAEGRLLQSREQTILREVTEEAE